MRSITPSILPPGLRLSGQFSRAGLNGRDRVVREDTFFRGLFSKMRKSGHRVDLKIARPMVRNGETCRVEVSFQPALGVPPFEHLIAFMKKLYPGHEVIAEDIEQVSPGLLVVGTKINDERIIVASVNRVPPEFSPIGTGLFRREGDDHHIWALERSSDGQFALVRKVEERVDPVYGDLPEFSRAASAGEPERIRIGARVRTPNGFGTVADIDRAGNVLVDMPRGARQLYRKSQVIVDPVTKDPGLPPQQKGSYKLSEETAWMVDYYTAAYGDRDFAEQLVKKSFGGSSE